MKTDLTKAIELSLLHYYPADMCGIKINKFRDQHTAFEVPVECGTTLAGIVDCVRVSEYFGDKKRQRVCIMHNWKKEGIRKIAARCPRGIADSDSVPHFCDEYQCQMNALSIVGSPKILFVCFELKISKADFKSKNGHNFVGNLNFYVVPSSLYADIKDLVPENIGIVVYYDTEKMCGLRKKKDSAYREMTDEEQKWMLLSVMKRVRAMDKAEANKKHKNTDAEWLCI